MKRILTKDLQPEMVVARTIFSSDGRILLHSGMLLTTSYISRLTELGINSIYIRDELFGEVNVRDVISDETRAQTVAVVRDAFDKLEKNHSLNICLVKQMVDDIIDELLANRNIMLSLSDIRAFDDYTFAHSVNVCVLSIMTAITMGYNHLELAELGIGALLHDIGKIKVKIDILNKPGELTREEFEEMKKHAQFGFEILRTYEDVSLLSAHIAFQHHERWDGHGYPRNLGGEHIHKYARIVAAADIYDALLADRPYRPAYSLNQTLTILKRMSGIYLDPECVTALIANIAVYPIGTLVMLNTGDIGIVIDVNREYPTRPIIRVVLDSRGRKLLNPHEIDLSKFSTIMIVRPLNEPEIENMTG